MTTSKLFSLFVGRKKKKKNKKLGEEGTTLSGDVVELSGNRRTELPRHIHVQKINKNF